MRLRERCAGSLAPDVRHERRQSREAHYWRGPSHRDARRWLREKPIEARRRFYRSHPSKHSLSSIAGITKYIQDREVQSGGRRQRSEEHTSELQSLMRISYAVFCLKNTKTSSNASSSSVTHSSTTSHSTYEKQQASTVIYIITLVFCSTLITIELLIGASKCSIIF